MFSPDSDVSGSGSDVSHSDDDAVERHARAQVVLDDRLTHLENETKAMIKVLATSCVILFGLFYWAVSS